MNVTIRPLKMLILCGSALVALTAACAAPYGGAHLIPAKKIIEPIRGYHVQPPDIIETPRGSRIHGSICRHNVTAYSIDTLKIEWINARADVMASTTAHVYGMPSWRRPGCALYSADTDWKIAEGDTIRIR